MNRDDALGFGTHLILDGFRADPSSLEDRPGIEALVAALGSLFERSSDGGTVLLRPSEDGTDGLSAVRIGGEAHLCVHTFTTLKKVSLEAFSTRALPVEAITEGFVEHFAVGRFECRLHGRGRRFPRRAQARERALVGDRAYARIRLRDLLSG